MPSRLIEDETGVGAARDLPRYFRQMPGHGMSIAPRHHKCRSFAIFGADRAEYMDRSRSLVLLVPMARSPVRPSPGDFVICPIRASS